MLDPIAEIERKLAAYPAVRHLREGDSIAIEPVNENGFAISLHPSRDGWLVAFGSRFHEHFETAEDALSFIAFGLSDSCRLREIHFPFLVRALVDRRNGETWISIYETGSLARPIPQRPRHRTFQNAVIRG